MKLIVLIGLLLIVGCSSNQPYINPCKNPELTTAKCHDFKFPNLFNTFEEEFKWEVRR